MSAQDDYLFDPSSPPDPAVAELEDSLRPLAEAPPMPALPPRGADPRVLDQGIALMNVNALDSLPASRSGGPTIALVIGAFVAGIAAALAGVALLRPAVEPGPGPTPAPEVAPVAGVEREPEPESAVAGLVLPEEAEPAAKWKQRLGVKVDGDWARVTMVVVDGAFTEDQFPSDELEFWAFTKQTERIHEFENLPEWGTEYSPDLDPGDYTVCAALQTGQPRPGFERVTQYLYASHACASLVVAADGTLSVSELELHGPEPKLEARPAGSRSPDLKDPFRSDPKKPAKKKPAKPINSPDLTDPFKR